jgi:AbrB family looped-hinge helix DNA binding protein
MAMKSTNIIRRIDDLGRVVIPKEIRRQMGIKEGEPLEIYINPSERMVGFKKYERVDLAFVLNDLRNEIIGYNDYDDEDTEAMVNLIEEIENILNKY